MAVTLPLCGVQGTLVEKHLNFGTLGKGLPIKVWPTTTTKKHPAGLASPYIHPEGFVFTWKVHLLRSPYRGFRRDGLTVVHISRSGEFLLSGRASSGVSGVSDWKSRSPPSSWLSRVKLPPSGIAGSLSEGVSTFLFLLGDRVSRRATFWKERITLERAGGATVVTGWGGSGTAIATAEEGAAVAATVAGAALAAWASYCISQEGM